MKYRELYAKLLEYAPMEISDRFVSDGAYDNSGMILETTEEVEKAVFSLDLTSKSVDYAISVGAKVIVTHHPAIYRPIKNILSNSALLKAANFGIGIISCHLNLDGAKEGIDYYLAKGLGGEIVEILDDFGNGEGYGRVSLLNTSLGELFEKVKREFKTDKVWCYGDKLSSINKAASFCGGGLGDEEVEMAKRVGADVAISADVPHHVILHAIESGLNLICLTHYASENYGMKKFSEEFSKKITNLKIYYFDDARFV